MADTKGLTAGEVKIPAQGGEMPAYRAMPETGDVIPILKAPVLGLYGGADESITNIQINRMKGGLAAIRSKSEIVVYPTAPHGFHADYRPSYREADARDGWTRLLDWFARHGVA